MAIVSNNSQNLLTGLSTFWQRLFADQATLNGYFQGTEQLLGQVYLNMLETVLTSSINNCPVFHTELWQNLVFNQAQVEVTYTGTPVWGGGYPWGGSSPWGTGPGAATYNIALPDNIVDIKYLYNQIFGPNVIWEYGLDYVLLQEVDPSGTEQTTYIQFFSDPFTANNGSVVAGVPYNEVNIVPVVYQTGGDGIVGNLPSTASNVFHSDSIELTPYDTTHQLQLTSTVNNVSGTYAIATVTDENDCTLSFVSGQNVLLQPTVGVQWSLQSAPTVAQISMWAPDAQIDEFWLANNFGSLIGIFQPSSETYKLLIQGVFQYFMLGPAVTRMEAALNVMNGFPVATSDSEVALSYDSVTGILTTNLDVYGPFNSAMPLRADIQSAITAIPPSPFPLQAFEPFSSAFTVNDYVNDPTWWYDQNIPPNLLTLAPPPPLPGNVVNSPTDVANFAAFWAGRSQVTPNLYPLICGLPVDSTGTGDVNYFNELYSGYVLPDVYDVPVCGDPGLICGADEDGFIPNLANRPPLHHNYAYQVFNRYIKWNSFEIVVDSATVTAGLAFTNAQFQDVILAGKPSYTFCFSDLFPT